VGKLLQQIKIILVASWWHHHEWHHFQIFNWSKTTHFYRLLKFYT